MHGQEQYRFWTAFTLQEENKNLLRLKKHRCASLEFKNDWISIRYMEVIKSFESWFGGKLSRNLESPSFLKRQVLEIFSHIPGLISV